MAPKIYLGVIYGTGSIFRISGFLDLLTLKRVFLNSALFREQFLAIYPPLLKNRKIDLAVARVLRFSISWRHMKIQLICYHFQRFFFIFDENYDFQSQNSKKSRFSAKKQSFSNRQKGVRRSQNRKKFIFEFFWVKRSETPGDDSRGPEKML